MFLLKKPEKIHCFFFYIIKVGPAAYETIAFIYPGAEGFTETIQENINKYNPAENLPILKDN